MAYPFERLPNAREICFALNDIPEEWSLTPIWEKSPKRKNWQTEEKLDIGAIAELIYDGEQRVSKHGRPYTMYASGYGLRTGDYSNGLIAVDVDGLSAQSLLKEICQGADCHLDTISWTSGKTGRYQVLYKIPDDYREELKDFKRAVVTEINGIKAKQNEEGKFVECLEFRYNNVQSCLPPSRHPETGSYKWITPPSETPVLEAPDWLIETLLKIKDNQIDVDKPIDWTQYKKTVARGLGNSTDLVDFLYNDVLSRLSPEQIFNWSGHNFKAVGKVFKGCPPWRQSVSGTSFHIWHDGKHWAWQDKQTGEGGGAIHYRHKLNGGTGKPRGKDFAQIVKQLASDAGVSMPTFSPESVIVAEGVVEKDKNQVEIFKANADILCEVIDNAFLVNEEKAAMIRTLTEEWAPEFKTSVWFLLEKTIKNQIRYLLNLPIPQTLPPIEGF